MGFGHGSDQRRCARGETLRVIAVQHHAIGLRRLHAAIAGEQPGRVRPGQEIEEAEVVVAGERKHPAVRCHPVRQQVYDAARIRPAIDIVAEVDDAPVAAAGFSSDGVVHLFQQVEPAVHVADGVDDRAFRAARVGVADAVHKFA